LNDPVFDRSLVPHYGVEERLSPLVSRVLAPNPGPFTFQGTGVHIVGSGNAVAVIDPGPDLPDHVAALRRVLNGRAISHILITHTHRDHSPAATALKAWSGAKIFAFGPHPSFHPLRSSLARGPATTTSPASADAHGGGGPVLGEGVADESGDRDFVPDELVRDGDVLAGDGFTLECLYTPGHISNHICYALREEKALFTGDHVMGWSTTIVAPPDGNMADYIRSLERLIARDDAILYPTHGSPIAKPGPFLRASLAHRRLREAQIKTCLAEGADTIDAIVARLYADIAPNLHKAAGLMVLAHLQQMQGEGRAWEEGGRWRLSR
jgi:glyoxylase-like metal-dependent hydrolase (beta-lactamase superfamily II)